MVGLSKAEMISKGKAHYLAGVKKIGASKYYECGSKGGMETAVCLQAVRLTLKEEDWANKWEESMS